MSGLEELAGKLTEAQRAAFLRSADSDMHPSNAGRISTYGDVEVGYQLYRLGFTMKAGTFSRATPLGLALRAHLQSSGNQTSNGKGEDRG